MADGVSVEPAGANPADPLPGLDPAPGLLPIWGRGTAATERPSGAEAMGREHGAPWGSLAFLLLGGIGNGGYALES